MARQAYAPSVNDAPQDVQDELIHGTEHAMGQYVQQRMREDLAMVKQLRETRRLRAVRPA